MAACFRVLSEERGRTNTPANNPMHSFAMKSPFFVLFEQCMPLETHIYQYELGLGDWQAGPHMVYPGCVIVERRFEMKENEGFIVGERECMENIREYKEWHEATSAFMITAVYHDKFNPGVVKHILLCYFWICALSET